MKNKSKSYILSGVTAALVLILADQLAKAAAVAFLKDSEPFVIIEGVFELYYLENTGAAFGILQGRQMFFYVLTIAVLIIISYIYCSCPSDRRFRPLRIIIIFIFSGAFGNLIDRLINGYVVDFFYFSLIDFPVFNVADIYVTCSTAALILAVLFYYKDDELGRFLGAINPFAGRKKEKDNG